MQGTIKDILAAKGKEVHSVHPTDTVADAVTVMVKQRVGAVLVQHEGKPVGIFTERDVLRRVVAEGLSPGNVVVGAVMTRELVAVKSSMNVEDALTVISERRCRHLPVVENGALVGLISSGDLNHALTRDRTVQIRQLVDFITGKYPA